VIGWGLKVLRGTVPHCWMHQLLVMLWFCRVGQTWTQSPGNVAGLCRPLKAFMLCSWLLAIHPYYL
jgi:hypothetical protein